MFIKRLGGKMKKTRLTRYILAVILIIGIIAIISSTILRYNLNPKEIYKVSNDNLIEDGSFENFNKEAWDCCPNNAGNASIFVSKSEDLLDGDYSLNLTSSNHCACTSHPVMQFDNTKKYYLSFYYKGDNPRFCNWVDGDKNCIPQIKFSQTN